jgi:hypothetical protein
MRYALVMVKWMYVMWQRYIIALGGIFFGFIIHQGAYAGPALPDPVATFKREGSWIGNRFTEPDMLKLRGTLRTIDVGRNIVTVDILAHDGTTVPILARYDRDTRIDVHTRTDMNGAARMVETTAGQFEDLTQGSSVLVRMNADGNTFLAKTIALYK